MSAGALSPATPSSEDGMASVPLDDRSTGKVTTAWGGPLKSGEGIIYNYLFSHCYKNEEWLYHIIDDKNFEISSLEPPCTGGLKIPHTPVGTCKNAKKKKKKKWILFRLW